MSDCILHVELFSKIALRTRFHYISISSKRIDKKVFNLKYAQFRYPPWTMGACNAPLTLETSMNEIFYDCVDVFVIIYGKDIPMLSKSRESLHKHLRIFVGWLQLIYMYESLGVYELSKNILIFNVCVLVKRHYVDPEKIKVLKEWRRKIYNKCSKLP